MFTIYQKIKRLARPVMESYFTDLTIHDRQACANLVPGSVALWSPRKYGSHLLRVSEPVEEVTAQTVRTAQSRLVYFDAVAEVFGTTDWYMLECVSRARYGHVVEIDSQTARQLLLDRIEALTCAVRRAAA